MERKNYSMIVVITGLITLASAVFNAELYDGTWSMIATVAAALLVPVAAYVFRNNLTLSFLIPLFFNTIVVRNADQHDWTAIGWVAAVTYIPLLLQAFIVFRKTYLVEGSTETALSMIRIFIGLNWLTHCTEKLFVSSHDAGLVGFFANGFGNLVVGHPLTDSTANALIVLGGIVEFATAISLGLGVFSRFGAFMSASYLVVAQIVGGHFSVGYTWILPGGGWELAFYYFMVTIPFMLPKVGGAVALERWRG
ncbi:DoxX family protein [Vibrio artabrorum]|uniref:DoxX family membrane protein n=1 Tax=Vibrio artabrorum TaxID=446374 RepID=A0ABT8CIB3_9VIBR|nr:DoxX family membrane protein [Vibrio artabrorum]MDN3700632.1 DoxX family membrane protein [Vibrio artabrorum]